MRYYAIKISDGSSSATPATTSGSAGLPVASNGRVAGPVLAGVLSQASTRLGFRPSLLDDSSDDVLGGSVTINKNPQPWDTTLDPDITHYNVDFTIPKVPASVKPVSTAPVGGSGTQTGSGSSVQGAQWTSVVNGQNDPGALDIEFDISLVIGDSGASNGSHIKIWGIPFNMITQSSKFIGCRLQMWAGFTEGLPLANLQVPNQGLILDGNIWPALGNWVLNDLSLEFFVVAGDKGGVGGPTNPKNIVHNVPANQPFSQGIQTALQTAFPNSTVTVAISDKIKLAYPDYGFYQSIEQYANYLKALSHDLLGTPQTTGYQGIRIYSHGDKITAKDNANPSGSPIVLKYEDFVGQPTWIDYNKISIKTLLRGDINPVNSNPVQIKLPANTLFSVGGAKGAFSTQDPTSGDPSPTNNNILAFQGTWIVQSVRHIGRFRSPSMDSWVTVIEAVTNVDGGSGSNAPSGPEDTGGKQIFVPPPNAPDQGTPSLGGGFGSPT